MTRALAWAGWVLTAACIGVALAGSDGESDSVFVELAVVLFVTSFATVGALVATRRPRNPVGWIMLVVALSFAAGGASLRFVPAADAPAAEVSAGATLAAWLTTWIWVLGSALPATFLLLLFPDGRLPSRRWRPLAWFAGLGIVLAVGGLALTPGRLDEVLIENPVGVPGADTAAAVGAFMLPVAGVASVASLVFRYRAATREMRQQLKWITWAAALVAVVLVAVAVIELVVRPESSDFGNGLASLGLAAVPLAMGVAILRHRLYDVDVVINRTLVYAALTATLVAAYLALVLLIQLALSPVTEQSDLAIAASTLAVAALVRPLRARIQALVDRRFYRRRYDAARTLERFGGRVRDEVDLDALDVELREVVRTTLEPAHVSLWVRSS
jgi:hypothetical protein